MVRKVGVQCMALRGRQQRLGMQLGMRPLPSGPPAKAAGHGRCSRQWQRQSQQALPVALVHAVGLHRFTLEAADLALVCSHANQAFAAGLSLGLDSGARDPAAQGPQQALRELYRGCAKREGRTRGGPAAAQLVSGDSGDCRVEGAVRLTQSLLLGHRPQPVLQHRVSGREQAADEQRRRRNGRRRNGRTTRGGGSMAHARRPLRRHERPAPLTGCRRCGGLSTPRGSHRQSACS